MPFGGLLPLLQAGVEEAQELQHALLAPGLRQAGVVHHQVRVDLAVVAADVEAPRRRVVLLHDLHPGHEPGNGTEEDELMHFRDTQLEHLVFVHSSFILCHSLSCSSTHKRPGRIVAGITVAANAHKTK